MNKITLQDLDIKGFHPTCAHKFTKNEIEKLKAFLTLFCKVPEIYDVEYYEDTNEIVEGYVTFQIDQELVFQEDLMSNTEEEIAFEYGMYLENFFSNIICMRVECTGMKHVGNFFEGKVYLESE